MPTTNKLHQYSAGVNASKNTAPLLFDLPIQQGWKVYYEQLTDSAVRVGDAFWDINANGGGTIIAGSENSIQIKGDGTVFSGYSTLRDLADMTLTSATKRFYMETRVKFTIASGGTVAANGWFIGWSSDNEAMTTGTVDAMDGGDELLGFGHLDTGTSVFFFSTQDNTEQAITFGSDLTSGTYAKLACYYDGAVFNLYKDDILISSTAKTQLNDDEAMKFQLFFEVVEAKANTFDVQYIILCVEL